MSKEKAEETQKKLDNTKQQKVVTSQQIIFEDYFCVINLISLSFLRTTVGVR